MDRQPTAISDARVPRARRPDPRPHVDRQRGARPRRAARRGRRRQAHLRRRLLRLVPRRDLRQPVPAARARARRRRRARPDRVVDRARRRGDDGCRSRPGCAATSARRRRCNEFFRLCDAGGAACAFSGDAAERFAALAQRLRAEPVEITFPDGSTVMLDYSILIAFTLGAMYDSAAWEDFARGLADIEAQVAPARRASGCRALYLRGRPPTRRARHAPAEHDGLHELRRGLPRRRLLGQRQPDAYAAWSVAGAAADARYGYFGRIWTWWPRHLRRVAGPDRDRYIGPFTRTTANPVLVVGNHVRSGHPLRGRADRPRLMPRSAC